MKNKTGRQGAPFCFIPAMDAALLHFNPSSAALKVALGRIALATRVMSGW